MIIHLLVNKLVKNIVADTASSQLCKVNSCNKQQQATTPSAIAMDAIKVTTNRNGGDWCHHREASKLLQNKPLERDEKRPWQSDSKPQAALPTSATRTLWERREHHNNFHPAMTTTIVISASIAVTPVRQDKQEALPWQEASSRLGKCMPLISYNASVRIKENKNANNNDKTMFKKWRYQQPPPWQSPS